MAPLISGESFPFTYCTLRGFPLAHDARLVHLPPDKNHMRLMRSASSPSKTPAFICWHGPTPKPGGTAEDDGWLLSVEYQARTRTSRLVILDARDLERGPVATAELTHHIPQGFHGNFSPAR